MKWNLRFTSDDLRGPEWARAAGRALAFRFDWCHNFKRKGARAQRRKAEKARGGIGLPVGTLVERGLLQISSLGRTVSAGKVRISSLKSTQVVDFPHLAAGDFLFNRIRRPFEASVFAQKPRRDEMAGQKDRKERRESWQADNWGKVDGFGGGVLWASANFSAGRRKAPAGRGCHPIGIS